VFERERQRERGSVERPNTNSNTNMYLDRQNVSERNTITTEKQIYNKHIKTISPVINITHTST
jgi:hypothetical protein